MAEEWGPWINHDGHGRPVPLGTVLRVRRMNGMVAVIVVGQSRVSSDGTPVPKSGPPTRHTTFNWFDGGLMAVKVRAYQIKRPRGMEVLDSILTEIDRPVKEREDA